MSHLKVTIFTDKAMQIGIEFIPIFRAFPKSSSALRAPVLVSRGKDGPALQIRSFWESKANSG